MLWSKANKPIRCDFKLVWASGVACEIIAVLFCAALCIVPTGSFFQKQGFCPVAPSEFSRAVTVTTCSFPAPYNIR